MISDHERVLFLETVWDYFRSNGRHDLPWRSSETDGSFDPYKIMVSELMLQQTQVPRVISKYEAFLKRFPTAQDIAGAELGDVLREWQGLGYNRRAKFLWQAAQKVAGPGGFPNEQAELVKLPGIGPNTAGAVLAYAYNQPVVFIETNVRTVYIHHFFKDAAGIADKEIIALVEQTFDRENVREFYWAIMDYGSYLKAAVGNPNKASKHYAKQSAFQGSRRQIRGQVIRELGKGAKKIGELSASISDERLRSVLDDLVSEKLIRAERGLYTL